MPQKKTEQTTEKNGLRDEVQRNFTELMAELRTFAEHETTAQREARKRKHGELVALIKKLAELLKLYGPLLGKNDEALLADMELRIKDAGGLVLRHLKT